MKKKKVFIAMSGGVDSSFVAALLLSEGYDCVGVTMILHGSQAEEPQCVIDARKVTKQLDIEHYVLDLRKNFAEDVIDYFVNTYEQGRTPNPCVVCNKKIKFGKLLEFALENGADFLATGHYARISEDDFGKTVLLKAADEHKDQSYFLYKLNSLELEKILMPLGEYSKPEVRKKSLELGLHVAEKKDSQEICFIPDNNYKRFLCDNNIKIKNGLVRDIQGNIIGEHTGLPFYTVGQRKGLPVNMGKPLYVKALNNLNNEIVLADAEHIFSEGIIIKDFSWCYEGILQNYDDIEVKIRYKAKPIMCKIDKVCGDELFVKPVEKQKAVTPGQFAVFYKKNLLLGGGVIDRVIDL